MTEARARLLMFAILAVILAGIVIFGAVQGEYSGLLAAVCMLLGASALLAVPGETLPDRSLTIAVLLFPAWILLQLVPLPAGIVGLLSPSARALVVDLWPGPLGGCDGKPLVAAAPPSWTTLSIDPWSTREFLFQVVAALTVYLAVRSLVRIEAATSGERRRQALLVIGTFTAAEALYGILESLAETPRVLWIVKTKFLDSATGTLINRNHFSALLYVGLGCTLALLLERFERRRHSPNELGVRLTLAMMASLQLAGLLAGKSRAGVACGLVVMLASVPGLSRTGRRARLVVAGIVALVFVPILLIIGPQLVMRFGELSQEWLGSSSRGAVLRVGPAMVSAYPLFGFGGGAFEYAFPRFRPPSIAGLYDYAHNDYFQCLVETGVVGLLLALAPVGLFARGVWRRWRGKRIPGHLFPVYASLVTLAVHEFVDFPLHIPALLLLVAFVGGLVDPSPSRIGPAGLHRILPIAALVLVIPAVLHSAVRWPAIGEFIPWPDAPDLRSLRAGELAGAGQQATVDQRCAAVRELARAQQLRPTSARYAYDHAAQLVLLLASPEPRVREPEKLRDDASRTAERARRADPWDAWIRSRLLNVSLSLGELDRAADDAAASIRNNPEVAAGVVKSLTDAGLPASSISKLVGRIPEAFAALIQQTLGQGDLAAAAQIVPREIVASDAACHSGGEVAEVLRKVHHLRAEPFLLRCLELPSIRDSANLSNYVRTWIVLDMLEANEVDRATAFVQKLRPGEERQWVECGLAERRSDWKEVTRLAELLLSSDTQFDPDTESWLRFRLARAYANSGQLAQSLRQLEMASELNPALTDAEHLIRELRLGINPFH